MIRNNSASRCRVELVCHAPGASSVLLVVSFDTADAEPARMVAGPDGEWRIVANAPPGEHRYKCIVVYDGSVRLQDDASHGAVHQLCAESGLARPDHRFWPVAQHTPKPVVYGHGGGLGRPGDPRWKE